MHRKTDKKNHRFLQVFGAKMAPKREAREAQKGAKKGAKIEANRETPKWSQNVTKMKPKWSQNGAKMKPK